MSKSIKLTDNTFWDSSSVSHNRITLDKVLQEGTLVQSYEWSMSNPVPVFQLNNLNLVADGGIYDIVFNFYNQGMWTDLGLWLPEYDVALYDSVRIFSRNDNPGTGNMTVSSYANYHEGRFYLGDMRPERGCFHITISLMQDGDGKTVKVISYSESIDTKGQSLVFMGGYLGTFATNITKMYFYTLNNAPFSGSVQVYRRSNIGARPVNQ